MTETLTTNSSKRILIIDDEEELRALLLMKFKAAGHTVTLVEGGEEAQSLLEQHAFDAVLCDLNLPNSPKGKELFKICSQKSKPPLFILITGYTPDSPEVRAARQAGLHHVFSKPLRLKNIFQLINEST